MVLNKKVYLNLITSKKTVATIIGTMDGSCIPPNPVGTCVGPFDVNRKMIRYGYAWYAPYSNDPNPEYQQAEQEAKAAKRGLWADDNPIPPWEWRKSRKKPYMYFDND